MFYRWPNASARKVYYVFHLLVADLAVPLGIMSIAYGLIAKTLWNGFKQMNVIGKLKTVYRILLNRIIAINAL